MEISIENLEMTSVQAFGLMSDPVYILSVYNSIVSCK